MSAFKNDLQFNEGYKQYIEKSIPEPRDYYDNDMRRHLASQNASEETKVVELGKPLKRDLKREVRALERSKELTRWQRLKVKLLQSRI